MRPRIITRLDIKPPHVIKGVHFEGWRKVGEPKALAIQAMENGSDEVMYIDTVASLFQKKPELNCIKQCASELLVPFAVGGGVRSMDDFESLLHNGADKVILNTWLLTHGTELIGQAARKFGSQAIVVHIEAKKEGNDWLCFSDGGRNNSGIKVADWIKQVQEAGCGEIAVSSVDRDGRRCGFDLDLIAMACAISTVPLLAASGAGSEDDIVNLMECAEPDGIIIGSLFHYGESTPNQVKRKIAQLGRKK